MISAIRKNNLAGAVYVFEYNSSSQHWSQVQKILPTDTSPNYDFFGSAILLQADTAFIGAYLTDNTAYTSGSTYVFKLINGTWTQTQELFANPEISYDYCGSSLGFSNNRLFVGCRGGVNQGAVHIYEENNGQWQHTTKIAASDGFAKDSFARKILVDNNRLIVSSTNTKVNNLDKVGAVYVYDYNNQTSSWDETMKIEPPIASLNLLFGLTMAISGKDLYISSSYSDEISTNSGSVLHYKLNANSATYKEMIKMPSPVGKSWFGGRIAIANDELFISAPNHGSGTVSIFENDVIFSNGFE